MGLKQINIYGQINVADKMNYSRIEKPAHTRLGVTTHNNGGFEVKETPEQIIKLMKL